MPQFVSEYACVLEQYKYNICVVWKRKCERSWSGRPTNIILHIRMMVRAKRVIDIRSWHEAVRGLPAIKDHFGEIRPMIREGH